MTTQQSPRVARYLTLLVALIEARKLAGGTLSEDEESRRVAELDAVWETMTAAEREEAEKISGGKLPAVTGDEPNCPRCGVSWQGEPIPETHREHYGTATHWRRVIAICSQELDRCVSYKCPDCGVVFDRA